MSYNTNSSALRWCWTCHPFQRYFNSNFLLRYWTEIKCSALVFSFGRCPVWMSTGISIIVIEIFRCFAQPHQENVEMTTQLGHNCSLPHHFQLTIQPSSYHSTPYRPKPTYWQCCDFKHHPHYSVTTLHNLRCCACRLINHMQIRVYYLGSIWQMYTCRIEPK